MTASNFSDAQKAFALKQSGIPVAETCRKAEGDLFQLEKEVRRISPPEMRRLKQLPADYVSTVADPTLYASGNDRLALSASSTKIVSICNRGGHDRR